MPGKKGEAREIPFVEGLKAREIQDISLDDLNLPDRSFQYRLGANVGDLKASLRKEGQREPIDVTGTKPYRIIDGFRRVEATRALGWRSVKALVHRGVTDEEGHKLAFLKNVVRKNLSPMEKANAVLQAKRRGLKGRDLAEYFGLSERQLSRYEHLLDFPSEIQKPLEKGQISMAHAKVLADFGAKDLGAWLGKLGEDSFSAKQLRRELRKASGGKVPGRKKLYWKKERGGIRIYPFAVSKDASKDEKDKAVKVLQEILETVKGWG